MRYVRKKEECSGCRACEQVCPVNCIFVTLDKEGFLYPIIDEDKCINCNKCIETCKHEPIEMFFEKKVSFAAKNINKEILMKSSSGGVFYELAKEIIRKDGVVYGAAFDKDYQVCQTSTSTIEGIQAFMGSKYVQSDTASSYREVKKLLDNEKFVLYSGTPCQIKGLKQYLNQDSKFLICISLICHGTPSRKVWERYIKLKMGQYAEKEIKKISFRDKSDGWRNMHLKITFSESCYSAIHSDDIYFQGFSQNLFLRPSCYQCKAKEKLEYADIVIGDFWGVENVFPELDDGKGVSCVIINSMKGLSYWKGIKDNFVIRECEIKDIKKRNPFLYASVAENPNRKYFFNELNRTGLVEKSIENNLIGLGISKKIRQQCQYEIIRKYLEKKINRQSVFGTMTKQGFIRLCVYAVTDLSELVVSDLLQFKEFELMYICDRNYKAYQSGIWGVKVVSQKQLINDILNKTVDMIIICNPVHEDEIFNELILGGVSQNRIISISNLLND